jgi:hypothetical protein
VFHRILNGRNREIVGIGGSLPIVHAPADNDTYTTVTKIERYRATQTAIANHTDDLACEVREIAVLFVIDNRHKLYSQSLSRMSEQYTASPYLAMRP